MRTEQRSGRMPVAARGRSPDAVAIILCNLYSRRCLDPPPYFTCLIVKIACLTCVLTPDARQSAHRPDGTRRPACPFGAADFYTIGKQEMHNIAQTKVC